MRYAKTSTDFASQLVDVCGTPRIGIRFGHPILVEMTSFSD